MKNLLLILGLAFSQALSSQTPPNDLCADAILIPIADKRGDLDFLQFTTVNATNSGDTSFNVPLSDVWFKFTTGPYIPARLAIEYRFPYPYISIMSVSCYDNCNGQRLSSTNFSQPRGIDSIPRQQLRPNTTYYFSVGLGNLVRTFQDTFSIRLFGEEDLLPNPFVFSAIGTSNTGTTRTKNKTSQTLTINNISSNNSAFVPVQRMGELIPADRIVNVSVIYSPSSLADDSATITVNTNRGDLTMPIYGYPFGNGLVYDTISWPNGVYAFAPPFSSSYGFSPFASQTGINSIMSDLYDPIIKNRIIFPSMRPRPGVDRVSFFISPVGASFRRPPYSFPNDNIEVNLSTTDTASTSFNINLLSDSLSRYGFKYYSIDLSAYHNRQIHIEITHSNRYSSSMNPLTIGIDDLRYPDNLTSIKEPNQVQIATLYPNPSSGTLTISLTESTAPDDAKAKVMDLWGRTITEYPFSGSLQKQLDLSHLPSGMYLIEVSTPAAAQTLKWVKMD